MSEEKYKIKFTRNNLHMDNNRQSVKKEKKMIILLSLYRLWAQTSLNTIGNNTNAV